jgi:hypothetical protein
MTSKNAPEHFEDDENTFRVSPAAHRPAPDLTGIEINGTVDVGPFMGGRRELPDSNRERVLLRAAR